MMKVWVVVFSDMIPFEWKIFSTRDLAEAYAKSCEDSIGENVDIFIEEDIVHEARPE